MKRSIILAIAIILGIIIYAYGFEVTQVSLEELGSPRRQESLTRILRALARPDVLEYAQDEFQVEAPIYVPCPPAGAPSAPAVDPGQPYMVVTPACAEPSAQVTIEGFNFEPNTAGPLNFIPPSGVSLQLGRIETDASGHFVTTARLRNRTSDAAQVIRAITRRNVGAPSLSENGRNTIDKIIETVFMALLATTIGTALSIPISFFAAQNLMRTVTMPLTSVALTILFVPMGMLIGGAVAGAMGDLSRALTSNLATNLGGLIAGPLVAWGATRWAFPQEETTIPPVGLRLARLAALLVAVLASVLALFLLSDIAVTVGRALAPQLGAFGFLGAFLANLGEIVRIALAPFCALIGAGMLMGLAGRLGQALFERLPTATVKLINLALAAGAGAVLAALIGAAVQWLYEVDDPTVTLYVPALVGAALGLLLALRARHDASLPIGFTVYNITRTILNALRSVEALIMVIVFAVWVGIGPFAGVLALGLHTVAALAKLYSEQVESILSGPLEAVTATGANRLQMIVYAVIPQIVPPYISFTMYRWDINVRMSTIIGFAGGGGIGFLLQQNINLLNYRQASAQILAIAIVVSLMDYLSSSLRQRTI
ncbi:MAG TPA: ABC transporter permease subunit [Anaerolineae bacterium]|nr:ABC transporter permease subunit [Anaerolineae bacterium]